MMTEVQTKAMSSRIVEAKIEKYIDGLRSNHSYMDAAFLEMELFGAKGYLPYLLQLCEHWGISV